MTAPQQHIRFSKRVALCACMLLSSSIHTHGQSASQPQTVGSRDSLPQPAGIAVKAGGERLAVPLLQQELTLADFPGMKPTPALADKLAHVSNMVQNQPQDGKAPTERTEVWLGRTKSTLYAVFLCYDHQPQTMRSHLARREEITSDDSVGLLLDPFQDRRRGILFQVNPLGVQADANWTENNDPDYSYDQVWNSEARRTQEGWMAVMAIPFASVRSRGSAPEWGVVLSRNLPRNSETDNWPRISQSVSGTLTQEGTLSGMEGTRSLNYQVNPYAIARRDRELNVNDPLGPYFSNRNLEGTAGGDIKAIVKNSIVVDGTINPDFSQVESDQPQFRVNQRYAVYYPELRPFFLENSSYFDAPVALLYTRTIAIPEFGARVTGKIKHTNVGFLTIDDRAPGIFVADDDPLHGRRALTTVMRVSQDLGKFSNVGVIYAQRTLAGSSNRAGGVDFNYHIDQHWTLQGAAVASSTHQLDGSYNAGPAYKLLLNRQGHSFGFNEGYRDFSQGFETDTGFVSVPQVRQSNTVASYTWYPKHPGLVQTYGLQPQGRIAFDRLGRRVFRYTELDGIVTLPKNGLVVPYFGFNSDTLQPSNYPALTRQTNFAENYGGVLVKFAPRPQVNGSVNLNHGATVNYNPVGNNAPALLSEYTAKVYLTIQPGHGLTVDNTYLLDRTREAHGPLLAYESQTLRTKINYQFTRALSARAIVEYDSVGRNPLVSALDRTKEVSTQVLVTWLPHPGTAIYVGYDSDLQNLDRSLCNRLQSGACDPNNTDPPRANPYLNDGRQFFIKASYLLRF